MVCVTLVILPPLNRQLSVLLKNHADLSAYAGMSETQQSAVIRGVNPIAPLTEREREVVQLILAGKSNKGIAASMCIGESTVKFHVSNVYAKHDVGSRAELICTLLRNRTEA